MTIRRHSGASDAGGTGDRAAAAAYIADLSAGLAVIARRNGFDALGHLLEMAQLEADNVTRHLKGRH